MSLNRFRTLLWTFSRRYSSFPGKPGTLEDCYNLFYLDHTCSLEELRAAYITTVKRYSDSIYNVKEIDKAYYRILKDMKETETERVNRISENLSHIPASSRSYLNYGGLGVGTPSERQREHEERKGLQASMLAAEYERDKKYPQGKKRTYSGHFTRGSSSVDAMVEGMISINIDEESLKDLPGVGKPLTEKPYENPYIDKLSSKLNEIMIDQNVGTEWIEMKKEINLQLNEAKIVLTDYRKKLERNSISQDEWQEAVKAFHGKIDEVNKIVWSYNMAVPVLTMQRMEYRAERLIEKMEVEWEEQKKNWKK